MTQGSKEEYLETRFEEFHERRETLEDLVEGGDQITDNYQLQEKRLVDSLNFLFNIRSALRSEYLEEFKESTEAYLDEIEELKEQVEKDSDYKFNDLDIAIQRHRVALKEPRYLQ